VTRIRAKVGRARDFATATFPDEPHRYEIWSPIAPSGLVSRFADLEEEFSSAELDLRFVVNQDYTQRVQELIEHARGSAKATSEPAYRLLQILTWARGDLRL
jgi:hypothetical protein